MEIILISVGIFFIVVSLGVILFSKNKPTYTNNPEEYQSLELEYRDLKNSIIDLNKEFTRTANFNINVLDEKIVCINEIREDLDAKILKMTKMMTDVEIYTNRLQKLKESIKIPREENEKVIKMQPKTIKNNTSTEDDIIKLFQDGNSYSQISKKTGKSRGEIEFILGLRKLR